MNQDRAEKFINDFDEVLENLKETTGVEQINKVKEYFVNYYQEIFYVEYSFKEIAKHNKKTKRLRRNTTNFNIDGTLHELKT